MSNFIGTLGNDIFTGGIDADTASGGGGNDNLAGADGSDVLAGGAGSDTLDGGAGSDILYSGDQSPPFNLPYYTNPYVFPLLDTGTEIDTLKGGDGTDVIFAGYGDNVDGGADLYTDTLFISFQGASAGVIAEFSLTTQTIGGGVITGIEAIGYVQGSEYADNLSLRSFQGMGASFTVIRGMGGNDTLTAGYYTGSLFGDDGDDVVDGRSSQYLMSVDGGAGNDTLYTDTNTFASANGGAGDDTIYAHGVTHGGAGGDTIIMQASYYGGLVYGDEGDDKITASSRGSSVAGGAGADTITGGDASDRLFSADFADLAGAAADDMGLEHDQISGGGGNDTLAAGFGDDVDGGDGSDTLHLSLGGATHGVVFDTADIAAGAPLSLGGGVIQNVETLLYLRGTEFADTLTLATQSVQLTVDAGAGDDVIMSQASSVNVLGGAGDDRFVSGIAADTLDGGVGNDTVDYSAAGSGVTVNLATGSGGGGDTLVRIEAVIGSAFDDNLAGDAGSNTLDGGLGADTIDGGGGADTVVGGAGADVLNGGDGDDHLVGGTGGDILSGGAGYNAFELNLTGDAAAANALGGHLDVLDRITDWSKSDFLQFRGDVPVTAGDYREITAASYDEAYNQAQSAYAQSGVHYIAAQVGADVIVFTPQGGQAVVLVGRSLADISAANVGPIAPDGPPQPTAGADDLQAGSGQTEIHAGAGDDTLTGWAGASFLTGDDGNDVIQGGSGFDRTNGNAGDDTVHGAAGDDWVTGGQGQDVLTGDDGADVVNGNLGADTGDGGLGNDTVRGGQGDDMLSGGEGNDYLTGDLGDDTLSGGAGADTFRAFAGGGHDVITDFNAAEGDRIAPDPGTTYTATQVGADVVLGLGGGAQTVLKNISLASIPPPPPPPPPPPTDPSYPPPEHGATPGASGVVNGSMQSATFADLNGAIISREAPTEMTASTTYGAGFDLTGTGFTYVDGALTGGAATHLVFNDVTPGGLAVMHLDVSLPNTSVAMFDTWLGTNDAWTALNTIFGGADTLSGGAEADAVRGFAGDDSLTGGDGADTLIGDAGYDTLQGDAGNDSLDGGSDVNVLFGGDGDDVIQGGNYFDQTNGNAGNDTVHGAGGDDWVTGGQGQDLLTGDGGNDILNGNLGADTGDGGVGNDTVRGGQGDDVLSGGDGNDFLTGDLGDDTLTGGAGADAFRGFAGGGHDVITDFNAAEGDRIQLDPGTTYAATQVGGDVVLDLGGGAQTVLKNVTLAALPTGWIVGG